MSMICERETMRRRGVFSDGKYEKSAGFKASDYPTFVCSLSTDVSCNIYESSMDSTVNSFSGSFLLYPAGLRGYRISGGRKLKWYWRTLGTRLDTRFFSSSPPG